MVKVYDKEGNLKTSIKIPTVEVEDFDEALSELEIIRKQTDVLKECLEELKECSKYLRKIYNPE